MTIKVGITGGMGSGKTIISGLFEVFGIPVYLSDIESKKLTATDPFIRKKLISLLGEEVFTNGQLNKTLLAYYLFSDPAHAKTINSIIHPRVKEDFRRWVIQHSGYDIIAIESAILFEAGFRNEVDVAVMVYAPLELRIRRAMERDNSTRELVLDRILNQMDDEEKKAQSDYVIVNDGKNPLIPQVESLISRLQGK